MKFRDGVTKTLLRQAMTGVLPEATRTRVKKTGWNAPAHVWFTGNGADQVRDLIASRGFRERGIYRPDVVEKLLDDHEAIVKGDELRENHMMFFWQLVNLEAWLDSLKDVSGAGGQ
jgi:asparagine synthase (glutamine-hydrolysing)